MDIWINICTICLRYQRNSNFKEPFQFQELSYRTFMDSQKESLLTSNRNMNVIQFHLFFLVYLLYIDVNVPQAICLLHLTILHVLG